MRICVCGGREYNDTLKVKFVLDYALVAFKDIEIINGGARGADKLSSRWAIDNDVPYKEYMADWNKYKNSAGPIRNREMLKSGFDLLIAFPGGKGTMDMINITRKAGIKIIEV